MTAVIRPFTERDVAEADRIFRLAFGTLYSMPDPAKFAGDTAQIAVRWNAPNGLAHAAEIEGRLVGSNILTRFGSLALFGPLTVHPDHWNKGIAKQLIESALDVFAGWAAPYSGFYTTLHTPKNVALYQRYGYWPRFLTSILVRPVGRGEGGPPLDVRLFSVLDRSAKDVALAECRALADLILDGLDFSAEIASADARGLGETVLLWKGDRLDGFAVCHIGTGTEAGSGTVLVKFGAVRTGPRAEADFRRLIAACDRLAASRGATRLMVGSNAGRVGAHQALLASGFQIMTHGVAMHRRNDPMYNRPEIFVLDEWR